MSVAIYPVLESEIAGLEPHLIVGGKALARNVEALEALAKLLNVLPLMHFYSTNADEVSEMMGLEEGEAPDFPIEEEWFNPAEALSTVRMLSIHIRSSPEGLEDPEWVLDDLDAIESTLFAAKQRGIRFHFAMDI